MFWWDFSEFKATLINIMIITTFSLNLVVILRALQNESLAIDMQSKLVLSIIMITNQIVVS